jgi:hypothetical protein
MWPSRPDAQSALDPRSSFNRERDDIEYRQATALRSPPGKNAKLLRIDSELWFPLGPDNAPDHSRLANQTTRPIICARSAITS